MTTIRDVMCEEVEYLRTSETAADAASFLAGHDIAAIPLCQPDGSLAGAVTDRDIVNVIARGKDPQSFSLSDLPEVSDVVAVGLDDSVEEAAAIMAKHQVRRLPVTDQDKVVGHITQGDIARSLSFGRSWGDL